MALSRSGCVMLGMVVMAESAIATLRVQSTRDKRRTRMLESCIFAALKVDRGRET